MSYHVQSYVHEGAAGATSPQKAPNGAYLAQDRLKMEKDSRFLTPADLAKQTRRSVRSIYRGIKSGEIPAAQIGGQWRCPSAYLDLLEERAMQSIARDDA